MTLRKRVTASFTFGRKLPTANSTDPTKVRQALIGTRFEAPQGSLTLMPSQHLRKGSLLGRAEPNGDFIIEEDFGMIDPIPWNPAVAESAGRRCDHRKTKQPS